MSSKLVVNFETFELKNVHIAGTHRYLECFLDEYIDLHNTYTQRKRVLDGWPVCAARKDKVLVFNKIYERLPSQEYLGILLNFTATNIQTNRMLALKHKF